MAPFAAKKVAKKVAKKAVKKVVKVAKKAIKKTETKKRGKKSELKAANASAKAADEEGGQGYLRGEDAQQGAGGDLRQAEDAAHGGYEGLRHEADRHAEDGRPDLPAPEVSWQVSS